jgi:hypothetical protein
MAVGGDFAMVPCSMSESRKLTLAASAAAISRSMPWPSQEILQFAARKRTLSGQSGIQGKHRYKKPETPTRRWTHVIHT